MTNNDIGNWVEYEIDLSKRYWVFIEIPYETSGFEVEKTFNDLTEALNFIQETLKKYPRRAIPSIYDQITHKINYLEKIPKP